jgi:hypothetical protein
MSPESASARLDWLFANGGRPGSGAFVAMGVSIKGTGVTSVFAVAAKAGLPDCIVGDTAAVHALSSVSAAIAQRT